MRRLVTMTPALIVLALGVNPTDALVISQVVLSFGIPFALVPLVLLTRKPEIMGNFANAGPRRSRRASSLGDHRAQRVPAVQDVRRIAGSAEPGLKVPGSGDDKRLRPFSRLPEVLMLAPLQVPHGPSPPWRHALA